MPAYGAASDMLVGTAIYTLVLGAAFVVFCWRGRQRWLAFWGATMVVAGAAYLIAVVLGYE